MQDKTTKVLIGLSGAKGRMCAAVARATNCSPRFSIAFGVDRQSDTNNESFPIYSDFQSLPKCDVIIDFSSPSLTTLALSYAVQTRTPIVVATTGQTSDNLQFIETASKSIPVFFDSNTSLGNCLLLKLVRTAAAFLDDSFDIEIVETHHRIKKDSPSGTALSLANAVITAKEETFGKEYTTCFGHLQKREGRQIGLHSIRGGTVVGKHEVLFLGDDERLTLTHEVENKSVFVHGALKAAEFLLDKHSGLYNMNDLQTKI